MPERQFDLDPADEKPADLARLEEEVGPERPVTKRTRSREAALLLKMNGATFPEIAKTLDFADASAARQAVEQAIIDSGSFEGDKEQMRALMGLTIDQWHRSIAGKIVNPAEPAQLEYMAMGLRLLERKSKLFGIDAATKIDVQNVGASELNELLAAYEERLGIGRPVEGDPFELTEGDDGVWHNPDDIGDVEDDDGDA